MANSIMSAQSKRYCIAHGSRSRVGFGSFVRSFTGLLGHVVAPKIMMAVGNLLLAFVPDWSSDGGGHSRE